MIPQEANPQSITILRALGDEIRLNVAKFVAAQRGPVSSCDVVYSCARRLEMSQPAMSHHFKKLVEAGVLSIEKRGTENYYRYNKSLCKQHGIDIKKM